ncbi:protein RRP5 homolog [Parasteatoda tepidariorum]|uniref:protein RRP5 homolog n=1 Tax=Parasteatoda tepidariorum TaxID=114398 RepID=UPI0039BD82AB
MKRKAEEIKNGLKNKKKLKRTTMENEDEEIHKAESLDIQTIREGMLLLGSIIEIRSNCLLMSIPGCLVGTIPVTNISNRYTEVLKEFSESGTTEEIPLHSMFNLGAILPCKVLQIIRNPSKKPTIILSIDPEAVNSGLRASSLYVKMVLFTAVKSIEDHGYVMETGINGLTGFLSFKSTNSSKLLHLGQVVPSYINKLPKQKNTGNVITLTLLSYEDTFPVVSNEDVKISSLLPGARISAYISEVSETFLYMKCLNFEACASVLTARKSQKSIKEAVEVFGTVLYVHPVTNVLYLHLGSLPTPSTFDAFFTVEKYDKIKNAKFVCFHQQKLFFKFEKSMGYVKSADVSNKSSFSHESLKKNPVVPKARVVFLHYMDNLIQLTFKESLLKMKIVKPKDVKIGHIYETIVKKHVEDGMFVSISPGLSGFVRSMFLSDSYITKPEKLHPVESHVLCRVLSLNPKIGLALTCKESLLSLPSTSLLDKYEKAVKGEAYKGVIVKKTGGYILVLFFNNVQGIVTSENIPDTAIFYIGQTVRCVVIYCNPLKKKLKLSLNPEKLEDHDSNKKEKLSLKHTKQKSSKTVTDGDTSIPASKDSNKKNLNAESSTQNISSPIFSEGKTYKAIIKKITAHQLNIIVSGSVKGRIHITRTGCSKEGEFPFKSFAVGQLLKVYVLKSFERRKRNYLVISHRNATSFLECSLINPSSIPSDNLLNSSKPLIGFLNKVYDTTALVWLSPYQLGKLDFVNISENPKILRKLKKKFKVGQSITVTAFSHLASSDECDEINLARPEISVPDTGRNVVGLLTVGSPDRKLVLKLPYGYTGFVHLTDVQDVYTALKPVIEKLLRFKFILCHVLEVNHDKKVCYLSLRKSRLYCEKLKSVKDFSPEMCPKTVEKGKTVKGYIKSVFNSRIVVNIGRNVFGNVELHKCSKYGCVNHHKVNEARKTFAIGNVVEVVINDTIPQNGCIPLSLPNVSDTCSEDAALTLKDDINWNELL